MNCPEALPEPLPLNMSLMCQAHRPASEITAMSVVPPPMSTTHQSAWETLAFQCIFPPQVWVVKRELLWVPFFGWGLAMLSPIAIDRAAGTRALRQTLEQGRDRLRQGFSIVIFPEGTRVAPGTRGVYHAGGAWLAVQTGTRVLPVAHDSGRCWGRKAFLKYPGLITVSIGEPLATGNASVEEIHARVERWIEAEMERIAADG